MDFVRKYIIILFLIILSVIVIIVLFSKDLTQDYYFLYSSIFVKFVGIVFYLIALSFYNVNPCLPNNIFIFLCFIYTVFGEIVWLVRDVFYFNLKGDPKIVSLFLTSTFSGIILVNILFLKDMRGNTINIFQIVKLSKFGTYFFILLSYLGLFVFTRGFSVIPLLMDEANLGRKMIVGGAGSGFGFILLVQGLFPFVFYSYYFIKSMRFSFGLIALISYFPFIIYSGRSLLVLPIFILFMFFSISENKKLSFFLRIAPYILIFFIFLTLFGLRREFGEIDLSNPFHLGHIWSDLFPEFRTLVNSFDFTNKKYGSIFINNLWSGQFPDLFYYLFGLEKKDYYVSIGQIVTQNTDYYLEFDGGIRLTIIGELMVSEFSIFFICLLIIQFILIKSSILLVNRKFQVKSLKFVLFAFLLAFSYPYGINIIMNSIQIFIFLWIVEKFVFNKVYFFNYRF